MTAEVTGSRPFRRLPASRPRSFPASSHFSRLFPLFPLFSSPLPYFFIASPSFLLASSPFLLASSPFLCLFPIFRLFADFLGLLPLASLRPCSAEKPAGEAAEKEAGFHLDFSSD